MESYPYPVKEGQRYINLNPGHLFCSAATQKGKESRGSEKLKPGLVASYDIWPGNRVELTILVEWEGMEKQEIDEASKKGKKSKRY